MDDFSRPDEELLAEVCAGSAEAFEALLTRYRPLVCRHLARMVRDANTADDLAQEVFLRLWTHGGQWHGQGALRAWLLRIATNTALNHLRSVRRRREQPFAPSEDPANEDDDRPSADTLPDAPAQAPEALVQSAETERWLRRLVEQLPEEKREVFRLVHDADMAVREVATTLGIPEGTVRSRLHYARKHLAREWEQTFAEGREAR